MATPPGKTDTAYDVLAAKIRAQIMSGELSPGHQLPTERELSAHYNVSRNTAREALRALASQGLVTTKRGVGGGAFVALPSTELISESLQNNLTLLTANAHVSVAALVEIREILEVPAAELAALRRTDDDIAALTGSLFESSSVDPTKVFARTRGFHATLLRAAHNPLLELLAEPVFRVLQERFLRERIPKRFWKQVDEEHREIIGYLEARDQVGTREACRAHLRHLKGVYEQIDRNLAR